MELIKSVSARLPKANSGWADFKERRNKIEFKTTNSKEI